MLTYLGFYASVFLNVVTEFSCALGSRFVIECWVHLQQSHFCHHKVFILKKQNHKDHKTQGRHRGEVQRQRNFSLRCWISPFCLHFEEIQFLDCFSLFFRVAHGTKETGLTNVIIVDTNFIQCIAISVAKAREKKRNVNNSIQLCWWLRHASWLFQVSDTEQLLQLLWCSCITYV